MSPSRGKLRLIAQPWCKCSAFGEKRAQPSCELPHYEVYLLMESVVSLFASISIVGIEKYAEKIGGITWRLQHFSAGGD